MEEQACDKICNKLGLQLRRIDMSTVSVSGLKPNFHSATSRVKLREFKYWIIAWVLALNKSNVIISMEKTLLCTSLKNLN